MSDQTNRNLARENAVRSLALHAMSLGSVRCLNASLNGLAHIHVNAEAWSELFERKENWERLEKLFGVGAVLNLDHPVVAAMMKPDADLKLSSQEMENAFSLRRNLSEQEVAALYHLPKGRGTSGSS